MGWPVTGFINDIKYNQPELHANGKNFFLLQARAGSLFFQGINFLKYKKVLGENMFDYPGADIYYTKVISDILKKGKASLVAIHLTNYDNWAHQFGKHSEETYQALRYLDSDLAELLSYVDDETLVIVFSDHSQLNVHQNIHLNENLLFDQGFYSYNGGSCFFVAEGLSQQEIEKEKQRALATEGVDRLLTKEEMFISGYDTQGSFGLVAKEGYYFDTSNAYKANHGYTLDMDHYTCFIATSKKLDTKCESLLDIAKIVCDYLDLEL